MDQVVLSGVVLYAQPIGEYDRRLVLLTRERGKVTAFARGARRPGNRLLAVGPFVFASFTLYEGRDAYTLVSADVAEYYKELASCQPGVYYGYYFLELASYYGQENLEAEETVNLIFVALKALLKGEQPPELTRRIFECRIMAENGEFALRGSRIGEKAARLIEYCVSAPVTRIFHVSADEETTAEMAKAAEENKRLCIDRKMKSEAFLGLAP